MSSLNPPTALEKVADSAVTEAALTVVSVLEGGPLAPLLPILAKSLAAKRQTGRTETALAHIDAALRAHEGRLTALSDEKYKLVNEIVLAVLHTTSIEKLAYLQRAVLNALAMPDLLPQDAAVLGRVVRDISAEEAAFLIQNFRYERIKLAIGEGEDQQRVLTVSPSSEEGIVVAGLISMGLLVFAGTTYDGSGLMRFSPVVAKLIALLRESAL